MMTSPQVGFFDVPRARWSDPDTSREAANSIPEQQLTETQERVLALLRMYGPLSDEPAGDSTILIAGHRHSLKIEQDGPRTFIQCPTLDSGSPWWEHTKGNPAPMAGTVTLTIGPEGWSDLLIL